MANEELSTSSISRAQITALADDPGARTVDAIRDAVARCDYPQATLRALARVRAGEACPAVLVAEILVGLRSPSSALALMAVASGDRAAAFLDAIANRRFPIGPTAREIEVLTLFGAAHFGAGRPALASEVRRLARRRFMLPGYALLGAVAAMVDDPNVALVTRHLMAIRVPIATEIVEHARADLDRTAEQVFGAFPDQIESSRVISGFTVRTCPRPGRNDPCPCGSGQKYKRCCADREAMIVPSPVAGLSWDDYVTTAADRMTRADVDGLSLCDLARVDVARLARIPLLTALRRFESEHRWDHAARLLDELARRPPVDLVTVDDFRDELIGDALFVGARDVARAQLALLPPTYPAAMHRVEIALADQAPGALGQLVELSEAAVRDERGGGDIEVAFALLRALPPLGILVARGCLRADRSLDSTTLLDLIEEARDALNLPPGDRAWDVFAALDDDDDDDDDDDNEGHDRDKPASPGNEGERNEARELKLSLRTATGRLEQLEQALAAKQDELATTRAAPAAAVASEPRTPTPDEHERIRALAAKVEELKGLVGEGNAERRELRNQLAIRAASSERGASAGKELSRDDPDAGWGQAPEASRHVSIPKLERRAIDAVRDAPASIGAETMRTIGGLCAGDLSAWRAVKLARDMGRKLFMARVGIHHRLLFALDDGELAVLDVVPREALDTTLKRLRANG